MLHVFLRCDQSQVFDAVVISHAIDVVNVHPLRNRTIHMLPHQSVDVVKLLTDPDPHVTGRRRCADITSDFVNRSCLWVNDQIGSHRKNIFESV